MMIKTYTIGAAIGLSLLLAGAAQAQDAMATDSMAADSMAADAMAPMMSDDELAQCVEQATAITFPDVAMVAEQACHDLHNGHDAMGGDAMGGDAMAPKQ